MVSSTHLWLRTSLIAPTFENCDLRIVIAPTFELWIKIQTNHKQNRITNHTFVIENLSHRPHLWIVKRELWSPSHLLNCLKCKACLHVYKHKHKHKLHICDWEPLWSPPPLNCELRIVIAPTFESWIKIQTNHKQNRITNQTFVIENPSHRPHLWELWLENCDHIHICLKLS